MAEIYSGQTGNVADCIGILGHSATNLITSIADCNIGRAPLLALAGQGSSQRLHKESHHINVRDCHQAGNTCMCVFKQLGASAIMINDHTVFRVKWMPFADLKLSDHGFVVFHTHIQRHTN